jgi:hypothetical protein
VAKKSKRQTDALKKASLKRLHINDFVADDNEAVAPVDIYIRLPKNQRLVLWVEQGDPFSKKQLLKISGHSDPYVYVVESALFWGERPGRIKFDEISHIDQKQFDTKEDVVLETLDAQLKEAGFDRAEGSEPLPSDALSQNSAANMDSLLEGMKRESRDTVMTQIDARTVESRLWSLFQPTLRRETETDLDGLSQIGEELVPLVSDEARRFKKKICQNVAYERLMRDSMAIYGIATLFSLANGYTLRGILEELALAAMFMDLPLADFGDDLVNRYYMDPSSLSAAEKKVMVEHPSIAQRSAREKLNTSQNCLRMIEGHHEYANGEGFPRGIRSELLPPLVRILAFAVLVFEGMKRAELRGDKLAFHEAIDQAAEPEKEPKVRKAHATTVQTVKDFLLTKASESAA